jgi:predicted PurR-regulated permease PerM
VILVALGAGRAAGGLVGAFLAVSIAAAASAAGGYAWGEIGPRDQRPGQEPKEDSAPGDRAQAAP